MSMPGGMQFNEEKLVGEDHHLEEDWKQDTNLIFLQFSVTDTGRGLSEEERASLFTRFSQASPRTHIHYGGSGLGLFISRRLTELQGGAIGLQSQPTVGSTFSFYIKTRRIKPAMRRIGSMPNVLPEDIRHRPETPLTNLSRPPPPLRIPSHQTDDGRSITPPSPRFLRQSPFHRRSSLASLERPSEVVEIPALQEIPEAKKISEPLHVLVVEDNLVNQRVLAKQLRNLGCIVSVANHGREALEFLQGTVHWNRDPSNTYPTSRRSSYHIPCTEPLPSPNHDEFEVPVKLNMVLMDWEMPIMNGLEAVRQIRLLEGEGVMLGRVPVIGVTANVRQQQIQTAMEAGMDDVVGKPFRVTELLVRMRAIIEGAADGPNGAGLGIMTGADMSTATAQ
jgi:CheY-like chemotaxis protein